MSGVINAVSCLQNPFPENGFEKLERNEIFEKILSLVVSGKDITSICNVCPQLRSLIDISIFKNIFFALDWYLDFDSSEVSRKKKFHFTTISHVRKAIADSRALTPLHPKGRIIEIDPDYHNDRAAKAIKRFHLYTRTYLVRRGESVWSLHYSTRQPRNDLTYQQVFNWIQKTRNIKTLTLQNYRFFCFEQQIKEDEAKLKAVMAANPFPNIPFLEYLRVDSHVSFYLCAEILRANSQVKKLHVSVKDKSVIDKNTFAALSLEGLYLEYFDKKSFDRLLNYGRHWPLKKLELHYCTHGDRIQMRHLSNLLSPYANSLEFIDLSGLHDLVDDETSLNLPSLKALQVKMNKHLTKIDFILGLKGLENLSVEIPLENDHPRNRREWHLFSTEDEYENIKLKGLLDTFQLSNSWELLPSLSQVKLKKINIGRDLNVKYERNHEGIRKTNL